MPSVEMYQVKVEFETSVGVIRSIVGYFDSVPTVDEFMECHLDGKDGLESWFVGSFAAAAMIASRGMPRPNGSLAGEVAASFDYPDGRVAVTRTARWVSGATQTGAE